MRKKEAKKSEIRGNIEFIDLDGNFLFYNSEWKSNWYISRNKAVMISESKCQLTFKTNGPGLSELNDPYFTQIIENKCVCCGSLENLNVHHVFPHCFIKAFGKKEKAIIRKYATHDVLPICVACHHFYEERAQIIRTEISKNLRVVLKLEKEIWHARKMLCSYFKHNDKIQDNYKVAMESKIRELLHDNESPLKTLYEKIKDVTPYSNNRPFEIFIQDYLNNPEKLDKYIVSWRQHFIDTMQPRHLPPLWDPNRKIMLLHWNLESLKLD